MGGADGGFPRLYAAASLKRPIRPHQDDPTNTFSAALCRGLIEALGGVRGGVGGPGVFRGFMPRPH